MSYLLIFFFKLFLIDFSQKCGGGGSGGEEGDTNLGKYARLLIAKKQGDPFFS